MAEAALPPADLLPVSRRASVPYRLIRLVAVPLIRLVFRFHVTGREHIPRQGAYIVIANHLGWLDWAAILLFFPVEPRIHFLADPSGLVKRKVEWFLVRSTGGYVPVDRERHGDQALYRHVYRCLDLGGAIAMFPEGNYGPTEGEMMPFKKGFAHFAATAGVTVVPAALSGTKEIWVGKRIELRIGPPLDPAGQSVESLTEVGRAAVEALLPRYSDPGGRKPLKRWLTKLF